MCRPGIPGEGASVGGWLEGPIPRSHTPESDDPRHPGALPFLGLLAPPCSSDSPLPTAGTYQLSPANRVHPSGRNSPGSGEVTEACVWSWGPTPRPPAMLSAFASGRELLVVAWASPWEVGCEARWGAQGAEPLRH